MYYQECDEFPYSSIAATSPMVQFSPLGSESNNNIISIPLDPAQFSEKMELLMFHVPNP